MVDLGGPSEHRSSILGQDAPACIYGTSALQHLPSTGWSLARESAALRGTIVASLWWADEILGASVLPTRALVLQYLTLGLAGTAEIVETCALGWDRDEGVAMFVGGNMHQCILAVAVL